MSSSFTDEQANKIVQNMRIDSGYKPNPPTPFTAEQARKLMDHKKQMACLHRNEIIEHIVARILVYIHGSAVNEKDFYYADWTRCSIQVNDANNTVVTVNERDYEVEVCKCLNTLGYKAITYKDTGSDGLRIEW